MKFNIHKVPLNVVLIALELSCDKSESRIQAYIKAAEKQIENKNNDTDIRNKMIKIITKGLANITEELNSMTDEW
jgi:hypothetical protein